ncbi:MAG: hypothetical protein AAGD01_00400 [Acidobacteriota bacterium]
MIALPNFHHRLRILRPLALCFALLTLLSAPSFAGEVVLNGDGELVKAISGTYGEVFEGSDTPSGTPVLALEITSPDGSVDRILVPGTDDLDGDLEGNSSLLFDDDSGNLFLVWESRRNIIHPVLKIAGFDGTSWSEPLVIQSNIFAAKGSPRLAVTRDSYSADLEGQLIDFNRTVLHLVWWEERAEGMRALYAPIFLNEGQYGSEPPTVFALNDLLASAVGGDAPRSLLEQTVIRNGRDHRSIILGFTDAVSGVMTGVEITVLPGEMGFLADDVRAHIIEIGWTSSHQMGVLSDLVRAHIIEIGRHLNPRNLSFVADEVRAHIIEIGRRGQIMALPSLASNVRQELIGVGASIFSDERTRLYDAFEPHDIVEVGGSENGAPVHLLDMKIISRHAIPDLTSEPNRILISDSGENMLLAWEEDGILYYRETVEGGWSEVLSLSLDTMSAESAYALLQQRTDAR